jgi:hypothetical protein
LHRFIIDGGVGAQQSEAENAVDDEQAVDVWFFLAVTIVEKRYVDAERLSDLLELRRADPVVCTWWKLISRCLARAI